MKSFSVRLPRICVKTMLWFSQATEPKLIIVAHGYNDEDLYTQPVWSEDKEFCLDYEKYQIWLLI